jgi:hypothetical protein
MAAPGEYRNRITATGAPCMTACPKIDLIIPGFLSLAVQDLKVQDIFGEKNKKKAGVNSMPG